MPNDLIDFINTEIDRRGISMRELARRAHVSPALISEVLNRNMNPTANFCIKIAPALDVPPFKLLQLAGHVPDKPNPDPLQTSIIEMFERLNENNQKRALDMLQMLVDSQLLRGRRAASLEDKAPT